MLPSKQVKASLALAAGKYVQEPNLVIVPAGRKTFPVGIEWALEAEQSYVIGSHEADGCHQWCVLDRDLKQVAYGSSSSSRKSPKKAGNVVAQTIHGGGASHPRHLDVELAGTRLKNGASYTLIAASHGVMGAVEFVAVREPKLKPVAKKRRRAAKKKAAPKKAGSKKK